MVLRVDFTILERYRCRKAFNSFCGMFKNFSDISGPAMKAVIVVLGTREISKPKPDGPKVEPVYLSLKSVSEALIISALD